MTNPSWLDTAIEHLRSHRIVFEPGLTDDEIARVQKVHGFQFPPDIRQFLQAALPVNGGFPNWRSESDNELRYRYLDKPGRGLLFDVEHNDFWSKDWGPRPAVLATALTEAGNHIGQVPRLIPVRSHHYLPSSPSAEGNPVFSVRQTAISCMAVDLPSYLTGLFGANEHAARLSSHRVIPFWTEGGTSNRPSVK